MRSKLKLHLEDLTVDSFQTTTPQRPRGTVYGEQCTCYTNCTCPGCPTCDASCGQNTCGGTCAGTCNTCGGSCAGTCDASCGGTCDAACNTGGASCYASCDGYCTQGYDATCRNIGTCDWADPYYACGVVR
ncbi:hypothetical protein [Longimicrobium sp.]|uniref:hypothetical protein n=1 Tax=Longimicrobium sp. TaxID=2029185 RepID=UPI003B3BA52A